MLARSSADHSTLIDADNLPSYFFNHSKITVCMCPLPRTHAICPQIYAERGVWTLCPHVLTSTVRAAGLSLPNSPTLQSLTGSASTSPLMNRDDVHDATIRNYLCS